MGDPDEAVPRNEPEDRSGRGVGSPGDSLPGYSPALNDRIRFLRECLAAADRAGSPALLYVSSWQDRDKIIGYEYVSEPFRQLMDCPSDAVAHRFRGSILERRIYRYHESDRTVAQEIKVAEQGTVRDGKLVYELDGKTHLTRIKTLRGDYRNADGNNANRLRRWEKHDFKPRILPEVRREVDAQIQQMLHLNEETSARLGMPVFNDADLQMAGYAAALKVLTGYTSLGGEDVTQFALRPRAGSGQSPEQHQHHYFPADGARRHRGRGTGRSQRLLRAGTDSAGVTALP